MRFVTKYLLFLRHVPLFHTMTFPQLRQLMRHLETDTFHTGDVIFTEGDQDQQLYLIVSGQVRIVRDYGTTGERTLAILGATEFLGEMGIFEHAPHSVTAVADSEAEILLLQADAFEYLLQHDPTMALSLGRALSIRLRRATQRRVESTVARLSLAQHMLVPLDGSPSAEKALTTAIGMATALQARITVLHVLEPPAFAKWDETPELDAVLTTYLHRVETEMRKMMEAAAERVRAAGLTCDTLVVPGVPFQVIVDLARSRHVDMIVMGSHGETGLAHLLLGSVAERVVQVGPCSVLIVPQEYTGP